MVQDRGIRGGAGELGGERPPAGRPGWVGFAYTFPPEDGYFDDPIVQKATISGAGSTIKHPISSWW